LGVKDKNTPLHIAAESGRHEVVIKLLTKNANLEEKNKVIKYENGEFKIITEEVPVPGPM